MAGQAFPKLKVTPSSAGPKPSKAAMEEAGKGMRAAGYTAGKRKAAGFRSMGAWNKLTGAGAGGFRSLKPFKRLQSQKGKK